jgi:hypothetical protein
MVEIRRQARTHVSDAGVSSCSMLEKSLLLPCRFVLFILSVSVGLTTILWVSTNLALDTLGLLPVGLSHSVVRLANSIQHIL